MLKGRGKHKGSNYERRIAKRMSAWWGRSIRRTPMSGGWGGRSDFDTRGDLVCEGGWPLVCELKCQEGWHLEQLLTGDKKCAVRKWWQQTTREAGHKKMPLLIFSRNYLPSFVMMRASDWTKLSPSWDNLERIEAYMEDTNDRVFIMLLDHFLDLNPPKPSPNRHAKHLTRLKYKFRSKKAQRDLADAMDTIRSGKLAAND